MVVVDSKYGKFRGKPRLYSDYLTATGTAEVGRPSGFGRIYDDALN